MRIPVFLATLCLAWGVEANEFTATDGTLYDIGTHDAPEVVETPKQRIPIQPTYELVENRIDYFARSYSEPQKCTTDILNHELCPMEKASCPANVEYVNGTSLAHYAQKFFSKPCDPHELLIGSECFLDLDDNHVPDTVDYAMTERTVWERALRSSLGNTVDENRTIVMPAYSYIQIRHRASNACDDDHNQLIAQIDGVTVLNKTCGAVKNVPYTEIFRADSSSDESINIYYKDRHWGGGKDNSNLYERVYTLPAGTPPGYMLRIAPSGGYYLYKPTSCPPETVEQPDNSCKMSYYYYTYSCPVDLNVYGNEWQIVDEGGDCGLPSCTNTGSPPANNCYRTIFTCPYGTERVCAQEGATLSYEKALRFKYMDGYYKSKEYTKLRGWPCTTENSYDCEFGVSKIVADNEKVTFWDTHNFEESIEIEPDAECTFEGVIDGHGVPIQQLTVSDDGHSIIPFFGNDLPRLSCSEYEGNPSGFYLVDPDGAGGRPAFTTYCEMDEAGGGWTLAMRAAADDPLMRYDSDTWVDGDTLNADVLPKIESCSPLADLSGNGNDGVLQEGAALVEYGSNSLLDVTPPHANFAIDSDDTNFVTAFTISMAIQSRGDGGMIFNKESSYELAHYPDGSLRYALFAEGATGWAWVNTGYLLDFNTSHRISFSFDGNTNTVKLVVDGANVDINSTDVPDRLNVSEWDLMFGERGSRLQAFEGTLDDIQIHNRALSDAEMSGVTNGEVIEDDSLVAYYDFSKRPSVKNNAFNTLEGVEYMLCFYENAQQNCIPFELDGMPRTLYEIFSTPSREISGISALELTSLIQGASLQSGKVKIGTNLHADFSEGDTSLIALGAKARLGAIGNNEADMYTPDSAIGIGLSGTGIYSGAYGSHNPNYPNYRIPQTAFLYVKAAPVANPVLEGRITSNCLLSGKVGYNDRKVSITAVKGEKNRLNFWNAYIGGEIGHIDVLGITDLNPAANEKNATILSDDIRILHDKGFTGFYKGMNNHTYAVSKDPMTDSECSSAILGTKFHLAMANMGEIDLDPSKVTCGVRASYGSTTYAEGGVGDVLSVGGAELEILDSSCGMRISVCGTLAPGTFLPNDSINAVDIDESCGLTTEYTNLGVVIDVDENGGLSAAGEEKLIRKISYAYSQYSDSHCHVEADQNLSGLFDMKFLKQVTILPGSGFFCSPWDCYDHQCRTASCIGGTDGKLLRADDAHHADANSTACTEQVCDMAHEFFGSCGQKSGCPEGDNIYELRAANYAVSNDLTFETTDPYWVLPTTAGGEYRYTFNGNVTMLLNTEPAEVNPLQTIDISAEIMVDESSDNDFIGIAFGHQDGPTSSSYYAVILGQNDQPCNLQGNSRGLSLSYQTGESFSWCQANDATTTILEKDTSFLYEDYKWYKIDIKIYDGRKIDVYVDGQKKLSHTLPEGTDLSGRVGLFNYSQPQVVYRGLEIHKTVGDNACFSVSCGNNNALFDATNGMCYTEGCEEDSFLGSDGKCYKRLY